MVLSLSKRGTEGKLNESKVTTETKDVGLAMQKRKYDNEANTDARREKLLSGEIGLMYVV